MRKKLITEADLVNSLINLYEKIPEPRVENRCKHKLIDILVIVTCSYLCGVSDWEEIELFANEKIKWFKKYLELPSGIPSHDTLLRVFKIIDPIQFEILFFGWIQSVVQLKKDQVIAFDGKKISGTYPWTASSRGKTVSTLNIWAVDNGITLGQKGIKSTGFCESIGIKECLDYLDLKGMIVTTDAGPSYSSVADKVCEKGADYLLPIKRSNKKQAKKLEQIESDKNIKKQKYTQKEGKRGRSETRTCEVIHDKKILDDFTSKYRWPSLKTIGIVRYYRREKDQRIVRQEIKKDGSWKWVKVDGEYRELTELKFYVSSRKLEAKELLERARSHWHGENKLNWHLDVTFGEDSNRTRNKVAAQNMSMIRKICLNLLKAETSFNKSLKLKKRKCIMNESYLEKVLFSL